MCNNCGFAREPVGNCSAWTEYAIWCSGHFTKALTDCPENDARQLEKAGCSHWKAANLSYQYKEINCGTPSQSFLAIDYNGLEIM